MALRYLIGIHILEGVYNMCQNCTEDWLKREVLAMRDKLKTAPIGHLDFYKHYIRVLEDKQRREVFKVIRGGK